MRKLGKKQLTLSLQVPLERIPDDLSGLPLELSDDGQSLVYTFDTQTEETGIAELLRTLGAHGIAFKDLHSSESSLEEIFVGLRSEEHTTALQSLMRISYAFFCLKKKK